MSQINTQINQTVDLHQILRDANITEVLEQLDLDLVGLAPVKPVSYTHLDVYKRQV